MEHVKTTVEKTYARWEKELEENYTDTVAMRRHLHQHPEPSFEEKETAAYIVSKLRSYGITDIQENVGNGYGIVAKVVGAHPGPTIAFRADFDALRIQEENDVPYKSQNAGVMHACGHDSHTATLLSVAKVLANKAEDLHGNLVLIHQNAEEVLPGGAKSMVEAGVMAGVMHAPLTGIFLIAELTGGYQLFMPLMIVCICSFLTISVFESHSIYALRLAREGKLLTHHTDRSALTLMSMQSVIEKDYHPISPDLPMGKLVAEISRSNNNFLPVLDDAGILVGVIDITKIRHIIFRTEFYRRFTVSQLMQEPDAVIGENDPMDEIMAKFDKTDAAQLPVVDINRRLIGYISRTRMYTMYRKIVADLSTE